MVKKKNKLSEQARIKIEQARYRKLYFEKFEYYCDTYGGKGTYALIPPNYRAGLFVYRIQPFKIVTDTNSKIDSKTHKYIHTLLFQALHYMNVTIGDHLPTIRLDDFFVYGQAIRALSYIEKEVPAKLWNTEFARRLERFVDTEVLDRAIDEVFDVMTNVGTMLSHIQNHIVWLDCEFNESNTTGSIQNIARLHIHKPTFKHFLLPDGSRPGYRVSWYIKPDGIKEISIKLSQWDPSSSFADLPIAVYIQSHALQRLWERIDVYTPYLVQMNMLISLAKPVIIRTGKTSGLLEYSINGNKYGYLVCELIDGDILIKTFLFLTNNGTPEGKKLNELSGLSKNDKKYLAIDRISSFITSDIEHNKTLKELFIQSGCKSLVYAAEHLNFEKEKFSQFDSSTFIAEYIKKEPVPIIEESYLFHSAE